MLKVVVDGRCLGERFTSNRTYWEGLVRGISENLTTLPLDLAIAFNGAAPWTNEFQSKNIRVLSTKRVPDRIWSLVSFPRLCGKVGADLAHMQYFVSPFFRCRTVTTIHDVSYFACPKWFSFKDGSLLRQTVPGSAQRATRVLTVSKHAKDEIVRFLGVSPSKIDVSYLAPQLGIRRLDDLASSSGLKKLEVRPPYLLLVGGMTVRKNWKLAVDVLAKVKHEVPGLSLVVTGPRSNDNPELLNYARSAGVDHAVLGLGGVSVEDLSCLYSAAAALVHTSLYEGFGMTPLEAMRCGCPVVAMNSSSLPEVVPEFGSLVDGQGVEAWSSAVKDLLRVGEDDRCRLVAHSLEFSWSRMARDVVACYERACD